MSGMRGVGAGLAVTAATAGYLIYHEMRRKQDPLKYREPFKLSKIALREQQHSKSVLELTTMGLARELASMEGRMTASLHLTPEANVLSRDPPMGALRKLVNLTACEDATSSRDVDRCYAVKMVLQLDLLVLADERRQYQPKGVDPSVIAQQGDYIQEIKLERGPRINIRPIEELTKPAAIFRNF